MFSLSVLLLSLATASLGLPTADPAAMPLTFLFTANISITPPIAVGAGPLGTRQVVPFAGGTFAGPKLSGKIPAFGGDWGLIDSKGNFSPEALYVLQTNDSANILVSGKGHVPHEAVSFETGNEKYAWLNTVVAIARAKQVDGGISVDVFQVA